MSAPEANVRRARSAFDVSWDPDGLRAAEAPTPIDRARWCVRHDRAACADGAWVRVRHVTDSILEPMTNAAAVVAMCAAARLRDWAMAREIQRLLRPRYRWTVRR